MSAGRAGAGRMSLPGMPDNPAFTKLLESYRQDLSAQEQAGFRRALMAEPAAADVAAADQVCGQHEMEPIDLATLFSGSLSAFLILAFPVPQLT